MTALVCVQKGRLKPTFALDTSSLLPRSCSHICRDVLLPCGCPVWSNRPIIVNVTLKTCSIRGLAHFSSSSLSSRTVNSSTVGASACCLPADAGSLLPGCSGHASSVIRLIPSRGRVVDIPPCRFWPPRLYIQTSRRCWRLLGVFMASCLRLLQSCDVTLTASNDMNAAAAASVNKSEARSDVSGKSQWWPHQSTTARYRVVS